jgi:hypothetical protein
MVPRLLTLRHLLQPVVHLLLLLLLLLLFLLLIYFFFLLKIVFNIASLST